MLDLVGNPEDWFSHNEAHLVIEHMLWELGEKNLMDAHNYVIDN